MAVSKYVNVFKMVATSFVTMEIGSGRKVQHICLLCKTHSTMLQRTFTETRQSYLSTV